MNALIGLKIGMLAQYTYQVITLYTLIYIIILLVNHTSIKLEKNTVIKKSPESCRKEHDVYALLY